MARLSSFSAAVSAIAISVLGGLAPVTTAGTAQAADAPRTATLVGSLQNEVGCPGDWAPDCAATELTRQGDSTAYSRELDVPAGTYELKLAINKSWDESYGADGVKGGANIPLVLLGPARLTFSYDDATHKIGQGYSSERTWPRGPSGEPQSVPSLAACRHDILCPVRSDEYP